MCAQHFPYVCATFPKEIRKQFSPGQCGRPCIYTRSKCADLLRIHSTTRRQCIAFHAHASAHSCHDSEWDRVSACVAPYTQRPGDFVALRSSTWVWPASAVLAPGRVWSLGTAQGHGDSPV